MTQGFRLSTALVALMVGASTAFGQVNYELFGNGGDQGLLPEEVDGWNGDAIRITHDGNGNASNGVNFDSAVTGDYSKLEFDFEFRIWNEDGAGDADGIGFAYADIDVFGEEADDFGYWGGGEEPNLEGSVGIGFDTWMNNTLDLPGATDATVPNSFSLHYDGFLELSLTMDEYDADDDWIQDGNVKRAHIEIVPEGNITVEVTDTATGETITAFDNEEIPGFEPYDGRIVFKARTGGENSNHDIDNISITHTAPDGTVQTIVHYGEHVGGGGVGVRGDFNGDGILDSTDIDDLTQQSASGANNAPYDLTNDGLVNEADVAEWIEADDIYKSWLGDANLDKQFNTNDLVAVLASGTYEQDVDAVWTTGDFNGDGRSNTNDLVAALSGGGYEQGAKAGVAAAVPEPCTAVLLLAGCLAVGCLRRRH